MSIIALASITGSPGVTTTAAGLAWNWPRPAMLLEADTSNISSVLPGVLRGKYHYTRSLSQAMLLHTRGEITADKLIDTEWMMSIPVHALPADPDLPHPAIAPEHKLWVVPGFDNVEAAAGSTSIWDPLVRAARVLRVNMGVDTIVDLGRLEQHESRKAMIEAADALVIVARPTLPDLFRLQHRVPSIRAELELLGRERNLQILLVDSPADAAAGASIFRRELGVDVLATTLPHSPQGAAVYSAGIPERKRKSPYRSAIEKLAQELAGRLDPRTKPAQSTGVTR